MAGCQNFSNLEGEFQSRAGLKKLARATPVTNTKYIVDSSVSSKMSTILSESTISREIYFKNDELVIIICPLKQVNPLYQGPLFQESTVINSGLTVSIHKFYKMMP